MLRKLKKRVFRQINVLWDNYREHNVTFLLKERLIFVHSDYSV